VRGTNGSPSRQPPGAWSFPPTGPKPADCGTLLVPGAASFSHVAFCSYRLESVWMIAGHAARGEDGAGALAPLRGAKPGMRVTVTSTDGTKHRYEVVGRELVVKKALPVDEIFAREGKPLLVLITCGGEYLPELRSHRDNVVVTAVPATAG